MKPLNLVRMFFDINLYENPKILVHILGKKPQNAEQVRDVADGCMRIRGDKLGIVGLGNIGTAVALRAKAFGFEVLYYDPEIPDGKGRSLGLKKMNTLNELLHDSDCVSVHCALTRQTYNLFNEVSFSKMRQVCYDFKSLFFLLFFRVHFLLIQLTVLLLMNLLLLKPSR